MGIEHVWAMTSIVFYKTHVGFYSSTHNTMAFTVISGGANGVDLEAEKLARHYGLKVNVLIPPCHPRKASVQPLTHQQLADAIPLTTQVANRLNKQLTNPISLQYIHRNYHVVKQAEMVLAFTYFQPERKVCLGGTGWAVEMSKVLNKVLYVYDVERNIWFWYNPHQDLFYACDEMSDEQYALPALVKKTAIVGVRNIYDYPEALLELQETFKRSLNLPKQECKNVKELCNPFKLLSIL